VVEAPGGPARRRSGPAGGSHPGCPWRWLAGAVQHGDAVPGQAGAARQQGRLVGLDLKQVVGLLAGDQELGGVGVGLERVGGDHHVGEVEPVQQRLERGDLLGGAADLALGQHRAAGVSIAASRCIGRPSPPAVWVRAPRTVLPSTAIARQRPAAGLGRSRSRSASQAPMAPARASASRRARVSLRWFSPAGGAGVVLRASSRGRRGSRGPSAAPRGRARAAAQGRSVGSCPTSCR
jgi:hypothetical protein